MDGVGDLATKVGERNGSNRRIIDNEDKISGRGASIRKFVTDGFVNTATDAIADDGALINALGDDNSKATKAASIKTIINSKMRSA